MKLYGDGSRQLRRGVAGSVATLGFGLTLVAAALSGCSGGGSSASSTSTPPSTAATPPIWSSVSTTASTLTVNSSEDLIVNSPFYGIQVTRNGIDITDDIDGITALSPTSWRYTFKTQTLNASGDTISVSLQNAQLAVPGHYVTVRGSGYSTGNTPQHLYQVLSDCEEGNKGQCVGESPIPGLLAAIKGFSRRYVPRDLVNPDGSYNFSSIFNDAAFLASKGLKLHVEFTVKTFARVGSTILTYSGDGATTHFTISTQWDQGRNREVHVYVGNGSTAVDTPFTFSADRTEVVLATAPPAGIDNVAVAYARDPFPEAAWQLNPPVGGWYRGLHPVHPGVGFVHAPWRPTAVAWMKDFLYQFQVQWTAAIAANPAIARTIEAISTEETANSLGGPDYSEAQYRAGLVEYSKFFARAVRRRALHEQLMNQIPGGSSPQQPLIDLAAAIIPWGARLGGPDLFNDETGASQTGGLEFGAYEYVHRGFHNQALTMIWAQNDSFKELKPNGVDYYTMAEQFQKAQKAVTDPSTAGGHLGIESEYVFWNMTTKKTGDPWFDWKNALPVIAANPVIQISGNDRNLWRRQSTGAAIVDQSVTRVNP